MSHGYPELVREGAIPKWTRRSKSTIYYSGGIILQWNLIASYSLPLWPLTGAGPTSYPSCHLSVLSGIAKILFSLVSGSYPEQGIWARCRILGSEYVSAFAKSINVHNIT